MSFRPRAQVHWRTSRNRVFQTLLAATVPPLLLSWHLFSAPTRTTWSRQSLLGSVTRYSMRTTAHSLYCERQLHLNRLFQTNWRLRARLFSVATLRWLNSP